MQRQQENFRQEGVGGESLTPPPSLSVCRMLGCWRGAGWGSEPSIPGDTCFLFQAEIVKRLSAICAQIIPFLTQEVRRRQGMCIRLLWLLGKGRIKVQPEQREVLGKKTSVPGLERWEKGLCRDGWGNVEPSAPSSQEHGVITPVLFLPSTSSRSCRRWNGPSR